MLNSKDQIYKEKFMAFAVRIVKLKNYLNEQKREYNIDDQILRSGTALVQTTVKQLRLKARWILCTSWLLHRRNATKRFIGLNFSRLQTT